MLSRSICRGVEFIPGFNPCHHCICQRSEVGIDGREFLLHELGQLQVALLNSYAFFWKAHRLEEWNDIFLPEDAFVLFLQIHERVAGFAVPDIREPRLHTKIQVITDNLSIYQSILVPHLSRSECP